MNLQALQQQILAQHGAQHLEARAAQFSQNPRDLHVSRPLTDLVVAYENAEYVADRVMPVIKVPKPSDGYWKMNADTMFNVSSADVASNRARPGEVNYGQTVDNFSTVDRALMDFVSYAEQQAADAPLVPLMSSAEIVTNFLLLGREIRVAAKVFDTTSYGSNTLALAGGSRFDDAGAALDVVINRAIRKCLVRPTHLVMGPDEWDAFRTNPSIKNHILSRASTASGATPLVVDEATVAAAFRLKGVIVGEAKVNTAREGAAAAFSNVWGTKKAALIRVEENPDKRRTGTFGYTFRWVPAGTSPMTAQELPDPMAGMYGGTWVKVVHSDAEQIVGGGAAGFLLDTVLS